MRKASTMTCGAAPLDIHTIRSTGEEEAERGGGYGPRKDKDKVGENEIKSEKRRRTTRGDT